MTHGATSHGLVGLVRYLVDRSNPGQRAGYDSLSPFGRALAFAPSSIRGETRWQRGRDRIAIRYRDGWKLELDLLLGAERLHGAIEIEPRQSLAVAFPRGAHQAQAVVQAAVEAGVPVIPRGAGTGLVGGAIGAGLVIDFSRHNRELGQPALVDLLGQRPSLLERHRAHVTHGVVVTSATTAGAACDHNAGSTT